MDLYVILIFGLCMLYIMIISLCVWLKYKIKNIETEHSEIKMINTKLQAAIFQYIHKKQIDNKKSDNEDDEDEEIEIKKSSRHGKSHKKADIKIEDM